MNERPVEPEDYGEISPAGDAPAGASSDGARPPSANQMKAEPDPADVVPEESGEASADLLAAAPSPVNSATRVAHVVPGHPDGEVDTTR